MEIFWTEKNIFAEFIPVLAIYFLVFSILSKRLNLAKSPFYLILFFALVFVSTSSIYDEIFKYVKAIWLRGWLIVVVPFLVSVLLVYLFFPEKKILKDSELKNQNIKEIKKSILSKLNQPASRIWFTVLIIGLLLIISSYIYFQSSVNYLSFIDVLQSKSRSFKYIKYSFSMGIVFAFLGYVFAFHYDSTVGRFLNWIRHG